MTRCWEHKASLWIWWSLQKAAYFGMLFLVAWTIRFYLYDTHKYFQQIFETGQHTDLSFAVKHTNWWWPKPQPFVPEAQSRADYCDASLVDQWPPIVRGYVLMLASLRCQSEISTQWYVKGREQGGRRGRSLRRRLARHVAGNEISGCQRRSHQQVSRDECFPNSTP